MAFYSSTSYAKRTRRTRTLIYAVSGLALIFVVIAGIYGVRSLGKNNPGTEPHAKDVTPEKETPEPEPVRPPEPEPVRPPEPNRPKVIEKQVPKPNPEATKLIARAAECINAMPARIIDAREILNDALAMPMNEQQRAVVKKHLSELADEWLFSRKFFPQDKLCQSYQVKPGDRLIAIGKQYKVPWEILLNINEISRPEILPAGHTIKVINGPFWARIYRSTLTMDLYLQDTFVRSFAVGLGMPGRETPTGLWIVEPDGKLVEPPWPDPVTHRIIYPGDPNYALGSRWIGLEGIEGNAVGRTGFGIHGTKDPETIGTASSRGCIRLHNGDAILLYNLLEPRFSRVEVVD
jgi:hypothetical protein